MTEGQLHGLNESAIFHKQYFINNILKVRQRFRHRNSNRNPIGDGGNEFGGLDFSFTQRQCHRGSARRANGDHARCRRMRFHPPPDAGCERSVTQRNQEEIKRLRPSAELYGNRSGAFGDCGIAPVFDKQGSRFFGKLARPLFRGVEIEAEKPHVVPKFPHALQLQRIRRFRGEDYKLETALARGIGHSLSEIARRGAHQLRRTRRKLGHEVIGPASLEGTNRVYRLDLENQSHAERAAQLLAQELRSVQENRIDGVNCFLNPLERKPGLENRMGSQSVPPYAAGANHLRIVATPRIRPFRIVPLLLGLPIPANPRVRADSIRAAEGKSKVPWAWTRGSRVEARRCTPSLVIPPGTLARTPPHFL